jgi:Leucine-rich repeat (LRR) protein
VGAFADCVSMAFVLDSSSHLNLWKKRLGRVPDSVWERTELECLVLAENKLSEVSEQIGRLKRLRMLDLGHNRLTTVSLISSIFTTTD